MEVLYQSNNILQTTYGRSYIVDFPYEFLPWVSFHEIRYSVEPTCISIYRRFCYIANVRACEYVKICTSMAAGVNFDTLVCWRKIMLMRLGKLSGKTPGALCYTFSPLLWLSRVKSSKSTSKFRVTVHKKVFLWRIGETEWGITRYGRLTMRGPGTWRWNNKRVE
jgi:hypothetical protein